MLNLYTRRLGSALFFGFMTIAIIIATSFAGWAVYAVGVPFPYGEIIGVIGFIAWVRFAFLPMMARARTHASDERELHMETEARLAIADQQRMRNAMQRIQDDYQW